MYKRHSEAFIEEAKKNPALQHATRVLNYGDCSVRYLREKLKNKGFSEEEIADALEAVLAADLIHEQAQAQRLAEYLCNTMWYGKRRIEQTLLQKGYPMDVIRSVDYSEADFFTACYRRMERSFPREIAALRTGELVGIGGKRVRKSPKEKIVQACLRYGFSYGEALDALEAVLQEKE